MSYKSKYKNKEEFVKSMFSKWLEENDKINKTNFWSHGKYKPEDYKFFIPTRDKNRNLLYYPPAFKIGILGKRAKGKEILGGLKEQRTGLPFGSISGIQADYTMDYDYKKKKLTEEGSYIQFAKDFDSFREYLQEQ